MLIFLLFIYIVPYFKRFPWEWKEKTQCGFRQRVLELYHFSGIWSSANENHNHRTKRRKGHNFSTKGRSQNKTFAASLDPMLLIPMVKGIRVFFIYKFLGSLSLWKESESLSSSGPPVLLLLVTGGVMVFIQMWKVVYTMLSLHSWFHL